MMKFRNSQIKTAFALGGGGARGIAHIGVIKALGEAGIKPELLVGTSMGAIIGAIYAQTQDAEMVENRLRKFFQSKDYAEMGLKNYRRNPEKNSFFGNFARRLEGRIVINLSYSQMSIFKQENFRKALDYLIDGGIIERLPIRFAAVAGDLNSGEKVVMDSGDIQIAVLASSSIPGFLPPVEYGSWLLTDGEAADLVPCETAKELGARFVIGVDVGQGLLPCPPLDNAFDVIFRTGHIKSHQLTVRMMKSADVIIRPKVDQFHWTQFDQIKPLVEAGYEAGALAANEIRNKLKLKKWMFWKK